MQKRYHYLRHLNEYTNKVFVEAGLDLVPVKARSGKYVPLWPCNPTLISIFERSTKTESSLKFETWIQVEGGCARRAKREVEKKREFLAESAKLSRRIHRGSRLALAR